MAATFWSPMMIAQPSPRGVLDKPISLPERALLKMPRGEPSHNIELMVGDKLKIELFQWTGVAESNKGVAGSIKGTDSWVSRQDLSGVFTVQQDSTIVLPILGAFVALDRSLRELSSDIIVGFRATYATEARAAVTIYERPQIYVLGRVKSPGAFRYEPGLSVFHAIALSGGVEQNSQDQWARIELAREEAKAGSAIQTLKMSGAELAVLRAERDRSEVIVPYELSSMLGEGEAKLAIDQALERRKVRVGAFDEQSNSLKMALDVALKNLSLEVERLQILGKGASARNQRVEILQGFVAKGLSSQALLNQAQAESLDNDHRTLAAKSMVGDAENKASLAKQELLKFEADRLMARETAILTLEKEVVDAQAALKVYHMMKAHIFPRTDTGDRLGAQFIEIVRKFPDLTVISPADPRTLLSPGDLVRVLDARPSSKN